MQYDRYKLDEQRNRLDNRLKNLEEEHFLNTMRLSEVANILKVGAINSDTQQVLTQEQARLQQNLLVLDASHADVVAQLKAIEVAANLPASITGVTNAQPDATLTGAVPVPGT